METTVTEAGPHQHLLTVQIDEAELEQAKDRAARRLAKDIKAKGFRPGKAPRRVVESMVGAERLRTEALEEALPGIVGSVLDEAEINPAVVPSVSATRDTENGLEVDITVTVWPTVDAPPEYRDRRIVVASPEVDDEDVDAQIDRLREQFAELEETSHPAQQGDFTMIDLGASRHGDQVAEASATDLLYEVGSQSFVPGLDEQLLGSSAGDIKMFTTELPQGFGEVGGQKVELRVLVKQVRAKKLPEVSDEWVSDVSEFETVAELRASLVGDLTAYRRMETGSEVRRRILDELAGELDLDLPPALVDAETESIAHRFLHELERQNIDLANYLRITGQEEDQFVAGLRSQADRNLRTRVLLETVAEAEGIEVDAEDLHSAIESLAGAAQKSLEEFRASLEESQVLALTGDILRQKTLDRLVELSSPVDAEGNAIVLTVPDEQDDARGPEDEGGIPAAEEE